MRDKIVRVDFDDNELYVKGPHVFQYDYGLVLIIGGIVLPPGYEVHFSNKKHGVAKKAEITQEGVMIPDEYLRSGEDVFAWVYIRDGNDDGYTVYSIQIPVIGRSVEEGDNITPVQHNIIDEAIAAMELAVIQTEENVRHYPIVGENYDWMVYDAVEGEYVDTGVSALGEDGYSPTCEIVAIQGGHRVTFTDVDGDHTFDVMDGVPPDISGKLDKPVVPGTQGQVLTSDGHGGQTWENTGTSLPAGGAMGDLLSKRSGADGDAEWITPANNAEQDNTRPITAAAVYTEIGNINALLATI